MKNLMKKFRAKILAAVAAVLLLTLAAPAFAGAYLAAEISHAGFGFSQYNTVSLMNRNVTIRIKMPATLPFQLVHDGGKDVAVVL